MPNALTDIILHALEDIKGQDIVTLDVRGLTDITDTLIIASGNSNRQVKALADKVILEGKKEGFAPIGVEGLDSADWVLVDFGDAVVHIMLPSSRRFYDLEKLWSMLPRDDRSYGSGQQASPKD